MTRPNPLVGAWRSGTLRLAAAAITATAAGSTTLFLLGAVAVQVRAEFAMSATQIGIAVSVLFCASAVTGPIVMTFIERLGARASVMITAWLSVVALLLIGGVVDSFGGLLAAMALGGVAQAFGQPAANGLLARGLRPRRQGIAFGIKQSGVPLPSLFAGLAVPAIALTVGWRWVYFGAAALLVAVPFLVPRSVKGPPPPTGAPVGKLASPTSSRPLRRLALASVLAAGSTLSFGAFLVDTAVTGGIDPSTAGALLSYASLVSVAIRLLSGWLADRVDLDPLRATTTMMGIGAIGTAAVGVATQPWTLALAVTIAFGIGWGWNPLMDLATVRIGGGIPAAASSMIMTGSFVGAASGPLLLGAVADLVGYDAAWVTAAAMLLGSAALVFSATTMEGANARSTG